VARPGGPARFARLGSPGSVRPARFARGTRAARYTYNDIAYYRVDDSFIFGIPRGFGFDGLTCPFFVIGYI